jgi:hypothetical protein
VNGSGEGARSNVEARGGEALLFSTTFVSARPDDRRAATTIQKMS